MLWCCCDDVCDCEFGVVPCFLQVTIPAGSWQNHTPTRLRKVECARACAGGPTPDASNLEGVFILDNTHLINSCWWPGFSQYCYTTRPGPGLPVTEVWHRLWVNMYSLGGGTKFVRVSQQALFNYTSSSGASSDSEFISWDADVSAETGDPIDYLDGLVPELSSVGHVMAGGTIDGPVVASDFPLNATINLSSGPATMSVTDLGATCT